MPPNTFQLSCCRAPCSVDSISQPTFIFWVWQEIFTAFPSPVQQLQTLCSCSHAILLLQKNNQPKKPKTQKASYSCIDGTFSKPPGSVADGTWCHFRSDALSTPRLSRAPCSGRLPHRTCACVMSKKEISI